MENLLKRVNVRVFRADKNKEDCLRFVEGHHKVLESYGVTQVTSANVEWMNEPYSYVILVEDANEHRALGGARLQMYSGTTPLPIETAVSKLDERIYDVTRQQASNRTGEFCGAWNSKEVAGYGIGSIILGRVCVSIAERLKMGSLFALASPASLKLCQGVGFQVIRTLGINGIFYYPKEDLIATALLIDNLSGLPGAKEGEREKIISFRRNPVQTMCETGLRGTVEANYNLTISDEDIIRLPTESLQVSDV